MTGIEHRAFASCEIRADGRRLTGLALPYETETRVGGTTERFARNAAKSTGESVLNVGHDQARLLAREPRTLTFESRNDGLYLRADLPATRESDDAIELVKSGVLTGLSVEFRADKQEMIGGVREIREATVSGVGLVARAAYPSTHVEARGALLAAAVSGALTGPEIERAALAAGITPEQLRRALTAIAGLLPEPTRANTNTMAQSERAALAESLWMLG